MKKSRPGSIVAGLFLFAATTMNGMPLPQASRIFPAGRILVTGNVSIIQSGDGGWVISPWFSISRGGSPLSGLAVSLEGRRLNETMPGQYAGIRITDITPVAGGTLNFLIKERALPSLHPGIGKTGGLTGTAVIGSLAQITQPVSGSSFTLAAIGTALVVVWSGGMPPFDLGVTKSSGSAALAVFNQSGLPGTSFSLPAALFLPGISYSIVLSYSMNPFALKAKDGDAAALIDPASAVVLRGAVISDVTIH